MKIIKIMIPCAREALKIC